MCSLKLTEKEKIHRFLKKEINPIPVCLKGLPDISWRILLLSLNSVGWGGGTDCSANVARAQLRSRTKLVPQGAHRGLGTGGQKAGTYSQHVQYTPDMLVTLTEVMCAFLLFVLLSNYSSFMSAAVITHPDRKAA